MRQRTESEAKPNLKNPMGFVNVWEVSFQDLCISIDELRRDERDFFNK